MEMSYYSEFKNGDKTSMSQIPNVVEGDLKTRVLRKLRVGYDKSIDRRNL